MKPGKALPWVTFFLLLCPLVGEGGNDSNATDFRNKLWNATRFATSNFGADFKFTESELIEARVPGNVADRWILSRPNATIIATNLAFENFHLGDAVQALYSFWMNDVCAVYLENMKPIMRGEYAEAQSAARHVLYDCLYSELRLLHRIMPFVTEELYHRLPGDKPFESLVIAAFPKSNPSLEAGNAEQTMEAMKCIIPSIRGTAVEFGLKPNAGPEVYIILASNKDAAYVVQSSYIETLAPYGRVTVLLAGGEKTPLTGCATRVVDDAYAIQIVRTGLVGFQAEIAKLEASAQEKRRAIEDLQSKMNAAEYASRVTANVQARNIELKEKLAGEMASTCGLANQFRHLLSQQSSSNEGTN